MQDTRTQSATARQRKLSGVLSLCVALALAGCGDSPQELAAKAQDNLQRDEVAAAEIHAREWLKAEPESAAGRLLLARVRLAAGDTASALAEAERAGDFGLTADEVVPVQAEILLAQGNFDEVVVRFKDTKLDTPAARASLQTSLARAFLAQGRADDATAALTAAQALVPGFPAAVEVAARLMGAQGKLADALAKAEALVKQEPSRATAWSLLGDMRAQQPGEERAAAEAYGKALGLRPRLLAAHAGLVQLHERTGDAAALKAQIAAMVKAIPRDPTTLFFSAREAFNERNWSLARERLQPIAFRSGAPAEVLFMAGLVEMQLDNLAQADALLNKALSAAPDSAPPRRALAALNLRAGKLDQAREQLKVLLATNPKDYKAWAMQGDLHARAGNFKSADQALAKAAALKPGDAAVRLSMARARLARGDAEQGLRMLEDVAQADKTGLERDTELVIALVRRGNLDAAQKAVDTMAAKQPKAAVADLLRGRILQVRGDGAGARKAFDAALLKQPAYLEAVSSLAQLDLEAKDTEGARKRYEAFLKANPKSADAMLALATLVRRAGGSRADVLAWLDKAVAASPTDPSVWQRAIDMQQVEGDAPGALARALAATQAVPTDSAVLRQLAALQSAAGEAAQARSTLNRMAQLEPNSAEAAILLGLAHLSEGNLAAAKTQIGRAAELAPDTPPVLRAQLTLALLGDKDPAKARALVLAVQKRKPKQALGWQLMGDVEASQQRWPEAVAAYETALAKESGTGIARQLHAALVAAARTEPASRFESKWISDHPNDAEFLGHAAEMAMRRGDPAAAASWLEQALKLRPADALLNNNLAAVQVELKQPAALQTALRAAELAPTAPNVLDTLAQAYAAAGQLDKALEKQAAAVELAPKASDLRLRLAELYVKADKRSKAKEELQKLLRDGTAPADKAAAERLLGKLNA